MSNSTMDRATEIAARAIGFYEPADPLEMREVMAAERAVTALRQEGVLNDVPEYQPQHIGPAWYPHYQQIVLSRRCK